MGAILPNIASVLKSVLVGFLAAVVVAIAATQTHCLLGLFFLSLFLYFVHWLIFVTPAVLSERQSVDSIYGRYVKILTFLWRARARLFLPSFLVLLFPFTQHVLLSFFAFFFFCVCFTLLHIIGHLRLNSGFLCKIIRYVPFHLTHF